MIKSAGAALVSFVLLVTPAIALDCPSALTGKPQSIAEIYKQLSALRTEKGEYETTAAFTARIAKAALPSVVIAAKHLDGAEYDADRAQFTLSSSSLEDDLAPVEAEFTYGKGIIQVVIKSSQKVVAQNGFGVKFSITRITADRYYLGFETELLWDAPTLTFSASPSEAQSMRPFLQLVIAGTPLLPATDVSLLSESATITNPIELHGLDYTIRTGGGCVGVRDSRSGKVLAYASLMKSASEPSAVPKAPVRLVPDSEAQPIGDLPMPPYPPISERLGEQGTTLLNLTIDETGAVVEASIAKSSGSNRLDVAALDFVKRRWRFQPVIADGKPVRSKTIRKVVWSLVNASP